VTGSSSETVRGSALRTFVGREVELAELAHGLVAAREGHGRLYLLSGEPGIGKTRLADELTVLAAASGMRALWGRCWQAGGAPAYWPWIDVLAGLSETLDGGVLAEALGDGAHSLADLVPALRARLPAMTPALASTPEEARFRLFRAASGLLRKAAAARGALIVLDDLHAADESSLLLLQFVARELRGSRVFLLGTFRDVEARLSPEIGTALGLLTREGATLALSRLGEGDSARFLSERTTALDPAVRGQIFHRTQGNPLFLEEMVRLLASAGEAGLAAAALPPSVREVIRQRLECVTADVRALLELAAVIGDETEPSLVADAAGRDLGAVTAAFAAAAHAGVLVVRERQQHRFSHALVREVLDRDLPETRKRELHAAVAATLERRSRGRGMPYAELAHHWLEGPLDGLPRAVDYAVQAAQHALSLFAFEDAIALLERVRLAIDARGGAPRLRAEVLIALGKAHIRRGAGELGCDACREAAQIGRALADPELLSSAALAYGLELTAALVDPELVGMLQEALAVLPRADSPLRVQVTARLAAAMQPHRDMLYPIGLAQDAIASARRTGEPETLLYAIFTGMSAMMDIVDPRQRLPLNLEAERLATAAGDRAKLLHTQARLAFDHLELNDLAGTDARIAMFERLAQQTGARRYLDRVPLFHSMRAIMHGRFDESERLLELVRSRLREAQDPQLARCYVLHREGLLRAWERHEEMVAFDPEARTMRAQLYSGPHWQNGGSAFTFARIEDAAKARMYLDLVPQDDWPLATNPPALMHLGEPLALFGSEALVAKVYARLLPAAHRSLSWGWTKMIWDGTATRVLALLAVRLGRWDEARAHFEQAIAQLERMAARPYLARTRYEYARALLANGRGAQAAELLEQARSSALELGMAGLVRLCEARAIMKVAIATTSGPIGDAAAAQGAPIAFVAEGEYWAITHGGATFRLRDSLGLQYLARLLAEPGRSIHVLELSAAQADPELPALDRGDAGELLDETAVARYRARLHDLQQELHEAEGFGDTARAERMREEIEFLGAELSRAVGLGGRRRRAGGSTERARSAVQRRIRNAFERIRQSSPALADQLERAVKTGTFCVFRPEDLPAR
jgi:tetratricopeptide (TPR) repeat protein